MKLNIENRPVNIDVCVCVWKFFSCNLLTWWEKFIWVLVMRLRSNECVCVCRLVFKIREYVRAFDMNSINAFMFNEPEMYKLARINWTHEHHTEYSLLPLQTNYIWSYRFRIFFSQAKNNKCARRLLEAKKKEKKYIILRVQCLRDCSSSTNNNCNKDTHVSRETKIIYATKSFFFLLKRKWSHKIRTTQKKCISTSMHMCSQLRHILEPLRKLAIKK